MSLVQALVDDVDAELMQDVEEEQDVVSAGRAAMPSATGGESPSGRKRKLVRPPRFSLFGAG